MSAVFIAEAIASSSFARIAACAAIFFGGTAEVRALAVAVLFLRDRPILAIFVPPFARFARFARFRPLPSTFVDVFATHQGQT